MRIVVFGASGNIGSKLVRELLNRGHVVRAFVYDNNPFEDTKNLEVVRGDIHKPQDVSHALEGMDIVVSTLGSWGTKSKDILSMGMRSIIPGMERNNMKRIVSLTGADARAPSDNPNAFDKLGRAALGIVARRILEDGEIHLELLSDSDLDWTVVRSPVMKNGSKVSDYKLDSTKPKPWERMSRANVVDAMANLVESGKHPKSAPFIRN